MYSTICIRIIVITNGFYPLYYMWYDIADNYIYKFYYEDDYTNDFVILPQIFWD